MRRFSLLLTVAPLALLSAPAWGQDLSTARDAKPIEAARSVAAAPAKAEGAQKGAAAQAAAPQDAAVSEVVVTGYRASLATAQEIKRSSDAIVDAVVAQDIGKLPDNTAAESVARVTGVQVNRFSDEASGVLVRGLPDVATTVNGRDIFTAELRRVQLQDFPSGALAALEVYKSGTADLLEPGLAGLINVRSHRPFDFAGRQIAGGLRGTYNDQSKLYDPLGNLLLSDRWDTPFGEVGALVNFSYAQSQYRNAVRWDSTWIVTPSPASAVTPASVGNSFSYPESVGVYNDSGKRWRPAVNASFQWKPAPNIELYSDLLWQAYRGRTANDWFGASLRAQDPTLSNVVLVPGTNDQAASFTKSGGYRAEMYRNTGADQTNTYQAAVGGKWDLGAARLSTDFAYTTSEYDAQNWSLDSAFNSAPTVDVAFNVDGGAAFSLPGFDNTNPANYHWRGFWERRYRSSGSGVQWRADADFDTDFGPIHKLQVGVRYTDRDADLEQGSRYGWTDPLMIPLSSLPVGPLELTADAFRGNVQGWRSWLMPTRDGISSHAAALRQLTRDSLARLVALNPNDAGYRSALAAFQTEEVMLDPFGGFLAHEVSYAGYGQAKYKFSIGQLDIDGVAGVRVVNTVGRYSGNSNINFNGVQSIVQRTTRQNYVDVLPNISVRIRPIDKLQIRLAFTETRTRPDFGALNPSLNITQNTSVLDPNAPGQRVNAYGSAGNPDLKPLTSKNYDATVEYYFSKQGSVSLAVFYRDLFGFIGYYTRLVQDPTYGLLQVSRPENAGAGKIKGVEVSGQTFFDFMPEPFDGFGVQANATYLDGRNRLPSALGAATPFVPITGLSKWSYNVALFYEKGKISTRLSYNGRSDWVNSYGQTSQNSAFTGMGTRAVTRLDYSLNYSPVEAVTLTFDATNLLAKPFNNYNAYASNRSFPIDIRDEGRYFGAGLRFRY